jgi:hypothetical protein
LRSAKVSILYWWTRFEPSATRLHMEPGRFRCRWEDQRGTSGRRLSEPTKWALLSQAYGRQGGVRGGLQDGTQLSGPYPVWLTVTTAALQSTEYSPDTRVRSATRPGSDDTGRAAGWGGAARDWTELVPVPVTTPSPCCCSCLGVRDESSLLALSSLRSRSQSQSYSMTMTKRPFHVGNLRRLSAYQERRTVKYTLRRTVT